MIRVLRLYSFGILVALYVLPTAGYAQTPPASIAAAASIPASVSPNAPAAATPPAATPIPAATPTPVANAPAAPITEMPSIPGAKKVDLSNLVLVPPHLGNTSLMFTEEETKLIESFFVLYDNSADTTKKSNTTGNNDDLSSLLDNIKAQTKTGKPAPEVPTVLPNLYLGSIVYYSPLQWSVWINGKKLLNSRNTPENPLYIPRISRTEIELVWKPASLVDAPQLWDSLTSNGKNPLRNIVVDKDKGTITVRLRPNQTFVSSRLVIYEGIVNMPPPLPPPPK